MKGQHSMIDTPINVPPKPLQPEVLPRTPVEPIGKAVPGATDDNWKRLAKYHRMASKASGNAFVNLVLAGVQVVLLKAVTHHGEFRAKVAQKVRGIAPRTITRYRQVGEQLLSAVDQKRVSVPKLQAGEQEIDAAHCTEEFILSYLLQNQLNTIQDLAKHAKSRVPELAKPSAKVAQAPAVKLRGTVEGILKGMTQEERNQAWQELDLLRMQFPPMDTAEPGVADLEPHEKPVLR
jgi:hypothetical protein